MVAIRLSNWKGLAHCTSSREKTPKWEEEREHGFGDLANLGTSLVQLKSR